MQINTAKFSPISGSLYTVFEIDNIFMIASSSESFDLFQKYNMQFNPQVDSPLNLLKNVYHQVKSVENELVLIKVVDDLIYVLCSGGAGMFVSRDGKLIPLLKTSKGDVTSISGEIKPGDGYLFATHDMIANLALEDILESLATSVASDSIEKLTGKIEEDSNAALLVIKSGKFVSDITYKTNIGLAETAKIQGGVKGKVVSFIDKTLDKLPSNKITLKNEEYGVPKRKKRTATLVGIVLLVVLGISIYFGLQADRERRRKAGYEPQLSEAEFNLSEAKELVGLSPIRAQELILSSRQLALSLKENGIEDQRLEDLLADIQENLGPIAGIYEAPAENYLDLGLISSEFKGDDLSFNAGMIRVLDFKTKRLVGIDIDSKRTEIISGPEYLPDALQTFSYEDRSFILSTDGIREVTDEVDLVIKPDWNPQKALVASYTGNIYVVDEEAGEILRYQGVRGGFLEGERWLGDGVEMDFSDAISMTIDGEIWILEANGNIDRLLGGVPLNFSLTGERSELDKPVAIYTDEESKYLYVLDTAKSRIAVFDKDGQYIGEYTSSELANASAFIVSESNKKAVFLADGKLYSLELKHIE